MEIASYIGFDNTVAAEVTAYAVLDYFGGPGVLGSGGDLPDSSSQVMMNYVKVVIAHTAGALKD